jgi:hypothetical protein
VARLSRSIFPAMTRAILASFVELGAFALPDTDLNPTFRRSEMNPSFRIAPQCPKKAIVARTKRAPAWPSGGTNSNPERRTHSHAILGGRVEEISGENDGSAPHIPGLAFRSNASLNERDWQAVNARPDPMGEIILRHPGIASGGSAFGPSNLAQNSALFLLPMFKPQMFRRSMGTRIPRPLIPIATEET